MIIRFVCTTDDKQKYYKIKERIFQTQSTIMREKVRELKDEFFAEFEIMAFGRTLYRYLKDNGLCKHLRLDPNLVDEGDE